MAVGASDLIIILPANAVPSIITLVVVVYVTPVCITIIDAAKEQVSVPQVHPIVPANVAEPDKASVPVIGVVVEPPNVNAVLDGMFKFLNELPNELLIVNGVPDNVNVLELVVKLTSVFKVNVLLANPHVIADAAVTTALLDLLTTILFLYAPVPQVTELLPVNSRVLVPSVVILVAVDKLPPNNIFDPFAVEDELNCALKIRLPKHVISELIVALSDIVIALYAGLLPPIDDLLVSIIKPLFKFNVVPENADATEVETKLKVRKGPNTIGFTPVTKDEPITYPVGLDVFIFTTLATPKLAPLKLEQEKVP